MRFVSGGLFSLILASVVFCNSVASSAEDHVRPWFGDEALWNYWTFGADYILKKDWKIVDAPKAIDEKFKSANLIDDNSQTYYAAAGQDSYDITIDLGHEYELGAFSIVTLNKPNNAIDSRMAKYEFFVSGSGEERGKAVAAGEFDGKEGEETVVRFPASKGRFVTLRAYSRPNQTKEICLRELSLATADVVKHHDSEAQAAPACRKEAWDKRDSAEAVDALGKDLLNLIFCTPDDINRSNLRARTKLEEAGKLKIAGKYAEGLVAFRDYYLDKLRRPQAFGIHANDVQAFGHGYAGLSDFPQGAMDKDLDAQRTKKYMAEAEALLQGQLTVGNGELVKIGEPGAVDWDAPPPPYGYTTKNRQNYPYRELWWGQGLQPLVEAYIITKDQKYLKRWLGYMDDWSMNEHFLEDVDPVINHDNSTYLVVTTIRMFAAIAETLPYDSDAIPAPLFARVMRKLAMATELNWAVYMRSNGNGWTPGAGQMLLAILMDEFKVAPIYFRETRRRNIEDIGVLQELRDGTETHQWPGYNFLLMLNSGVFRLMDARDAMPIWAQPHWEKDLHTVNWQQEEREALMARATYALHWATPNGEYPLVTHQEPPHEKRYKLHEVYDWFPQILNDPTNAKLYSLFYGDGSGGIPNYTGEWFPYGGYSIARDGWGKDDGYGAMFCSPQPGCGGVGSGCKNNIFALSAYGIDLLSDDLVHAYMHPTSPIQVDGKRQMLDFYVPKTTWPTAHRGDMIREWTEPAPWRWLSSQNFDLMEGVFKGVYSNDFHNRTDFVSDVSHQRIAMHARKAGMWILTDRLVAMKKHEYEQLWWLPLSKHDRFAFKPDQIVIDEKAKTIKTHRTSTDKRSDDFRDITIGNVNLSMYQFTDAVPKFKAKTVKSDEMYDWQQISETWHGQGHQQIVTVLFPRKPTPDKKQPDGTENDLAWIKGRGDAFEAVTPDDYHVSYWSISEEGAANRFALSEFGGEADAMLVVRPPNAGDEITGIVLGCKQLTVNNKPLAVTTPDFEFAIPASLDAAAFKMTPIYRPISPVKILPESDVFTDQQEVALACKTPGVFMTYTLDGTEPTPQSTRYMAPFKIDRTLTVKARGYRSGTRENPVQTSGTDATPISSAPFTKKLIYRNEDVVPHGKGLNFAYYEGNWKDLWLRLDEQKPTKTGDVPSLFDMSVIPAENPSLTNALAPRAKTYAFQYTGYIDVPADGVYTFHAPHEYTHCDTIAGYELQVYCGHAETPDFSRIKRDSDLSYWYPATRMHGFGTWSVPLKKGYHEFKVIYIDFRTTGCQRLNTVSGVPDVVWSGVKPALRISGPGIEEQAIPDAWLAR